MATLTPFRYAGSKNKLLPILINHLGKIIDNSFTDVFIGGGSVLLEVAKKYPTIDLYANDKDHWMYCFWKIVGGRNRYDLDQLLNMLEQKPTIELFNQLRASHSTNEVECAYKAIFFNRTTFSGILTSGPIGGQKQKSEWKIDCRYNFDKLRSKILKCNSLLIGRTIVSNYDFNNYDILKKTNTPAYLDPPYFVKGNMLYREHMNENDHRLLSDILNNRIRWVLSYDDHFKIRELYKNNNIIDLSVEYCINGKKTDWKKKNELIITSLEKICTRTK